MCILVDFSSVKMCKYRERIEYTANSIMIFEYQGKTGGLNLVWTFAVVEASILACLCDFFCFYSILFEKNLSSIHFRLRLNLFLD